MSQGRSLVVFAAAAVAVAAAAGGAAHALHREARLPPSLPLAVASAETPATHALPFGRILPERALPPVRLVRDDGTATDLAAETRGRWTVLQLMFAGCTTTCPIQGAIFQRTQTELKNAPVRFLSITIDPVGDTPAALKNWLARYDADDRWRAAVPDVADLAPLVHALEARGDGIDVHAAAAYLVDPAGRLAYVTEAMPSPETIAAIAREAVASTAPAGS